MNRASRVWLAAGCFALCALHATAAPAATAEEFAVGADVSFLADAEAAGVVFKEDGAPKPGLQIFKDHGYNWVRLRLFHSPDRLPNDLEYTIAAAQAAKKLGFKVLLNFHYSDTWADPEKQFLPRAWEGLSKDELVQAVFEYTRDTIAAFREAGAMPDMVQPGNEVIGGMLWPHGRAPKNWETFAQLFNAGARGVKAGCGDAAAPPIMMHIDRGGDRAATEWFFNACQQHGIEFDVIGQSYYPWWHGTLDDLRANLAFMANEYDKDIYLVEVAYNWKPAEYRDKAAPFPETPAGQKAFLEQVRQAVLETPHGRGKGIFWWEPAVRPGGISSRGLFDDEGHALPAISVFDDAGRAAAAP
ncbi:MAG TPA: glycosyl hydrolase 53 family protein [Lacipirellulaceae bacterium]|nr:glycosyl hydrolase 53 family protein [Lacipirellulaceae bacterium]